MWMEDHPCRRSIWVGNLPATANEYHVRMHFGTFGKIVSCNVVEHFQGPYKYAFVEYENSSSVVEAIESTEILLFWGQFPLKVERRVYNDVVPTQPRGLRRIQSSQFNIAAAIQTPAPSRIWGPGPVPPGGNHWQYTPRGNQTAWQYTPRGNAAPGANFGTPQFGTHQVGTPQVATHQVGTPQVGTPQGGTTQGFGHWPNIQPWVSPNGGVHFWIGNARYGQ
ncbi:hypothetical protein QBC47DRAFT_374570 [Echria macrotheca]|uniref:RRM domain-containing protein n=1 Tax=Echria macrotheca TaxID=438768 RepID=A0AAJ0BHK3_9PEZI|nr:hypothetical protein QBC47DRAFT_374570 [Echria macrotheca]